MSQQDLAGALAGLIVSAPVAYVLWNRQDDRRDVHPDNPGWSVYLAVTDLVYLTWLVVYGVLILSALFTDGDMPRLTDVLIIAAVVGFHEWASRVDRPGGSIGQIHRVVGSGIGLVTLSIGLGWVLYWVLNSIYESLTPSAGDVDVGLGLSFLIVGAIVWAVRWLAPWTSKPDGTLLAYTVVVSVVSLVTFLGTTTSIAIITLLYLFERPDSPGAHFEAVPALLSVAVVAGAIWLHHRPRLGSERTTALRWYQYVLAAGGLIAAIAAFTALVTIVFSDDLLVSDLGSAAISALLVSVVGGLTWWMFWTDAQSAPRAEEATSLPRKFYVIGLSIVLGLTAAGAVVGVLLFIFQTLLDLNPRGSTLATELALALASGAATWHLFNQNKSDKELREGPESRPYSVTVIASHPGQLASALPKEASLRMIHRGDGVGVVDAEMADEIVAATQGVNSIVWVDDEGFNVVPAT